MSLLKEKEKLSGADASRKTLCEILSENREQSDAIRNTQAAIPLHKSCIHNEEDPDFLERMKTIHMEVRAAQTDPEKLKMLARIKAVQNGILRSTDLNDKEIQFRDMLNEGARLSRIVEMLCGNMEQAKSDLNAAREKHDVNRAKLHIEC